MEKLSFNLRHFWLTVAFALFALPCHAEKELNFEFQPMARTSRYSLVDSASTSAVVSTNPYPGFQFNVLPRVYKRNSYLNFGLSQSAVRLKPPTNGASPQEEVLTYEASLFYEYHGRYFLFRLGPEYIRELFMTIDNNELEAEPLDSVYTTIGLYVVARFAVKNHLRLGVDYGAPTAISPIGDNESTSSGFFRLKLRFIIPFKKYSLLFTGQVRASSLTNNDIDQTLLENQLALGLSF